MRFTLDQITKAVQEAELTPEQRKAFGLSLLVQVDKPRGRPAADDSEALLQVAYLVRYRGQNHHAAATQVTARLPESQRTAARQRIYRKFRKEPDRWLNEVRLPPIEEEIRHLQELIGPSNSPDFGQLIRLFLKKESDF